MQKRAIILCHMDAYANSVKPQKLKEFLEAEKYEVDIYSTVKISRLGSGKYTGYLPGLSFAQCYLYCLEAILFLSEKWNNQKFKKLATGLVLQRILNLRGILLFKKFAPRKYDLLICEDNFDEGLMEKRVAGVQIFDLPVPFAEEAFYGGGLTEKKYLELKHFEAKLYSKADYLSFHWHTYADYVKQNKYDGDNFIDIGYGTALKESRARFSAKPKIVFLGYLAGYWVNLPLLEVLSQIYPIDVYGGPSAAGLNINYKGYAPTLDMLAEYQFGLVTISDDPLRQHSFSSKQLEYFSYGLPVFAPKWRKDSALDDGTIPYDSEDFLDQIKYYSDSDRWAEKSAAAVRIAEKMTWENAFASLKDVIRKS